MRLIINADLSTASKRLEQLHRKLGDLSPVMAGIGGIIEGSTRIRIAESKTSADGAAWPDLANSTKERKGSKGSLLVHRGSLLRSITYEASKDSVIIGSNMVYAKWHQDGTKKMPARPFLGISSTDYQDVGDLIDDFLNGLIGE